MSNPLKNVLWQNTEKQQMLQFVLTNNFLLWGKNCDKIYLNKKVRHKNILRKTSSEKYCMVKICDKKYVTKIVMTKIMTNNF